jgi:stage II sporulation protein D
METHRGSGTIHWGSLRLGMIVWAGLMAAMLFWGCHRQPVSVGPAGEAASEPVPPPLLRQIVSEPIVRVRIVRGSGHVHVAADGPIRITIGDTAAGAHQDQRLLQGPLTLQLQHGRLMIQPGHGGGLQYHTAAVRLTPEHGLLQVDRVAYPGELVIHVRTSEDGRPAALDVVNHVAMEQYLPGVLHRELFAHWDPAAFRAQAVAARSYAIFESARAAQRHFDVESTTASQVYGGAVAHERARQAVRDTAGVVLVHDGRVVPAYYSSCCGGTGQNAAFAFPAGIDIPPLRGRADANWCMASPNFRWTAIRPRQELAVRIAAWGRANKHPVAQLADIADIRVTGVNQVGRPARFAVVDPAGRVFQLGPEQFRFACNTDAPGTPPLAAQARLKSSHVTPRVLGHQVHFEDGRGHGHGVGMCQWCAQSMATHGYAAQQILEAAYPGATLARVY